MKHEQYWKISDTSLQTERQYMSGDYVWATSEKTRMRTLSLYLIRSIVEKHGGTINIDLATDTINIDVPEQEKVACAQEIEEQVGAIYH
jgi:sensor histidine kinase regulating citrate/malate metabolism